MEDDPVLRQALAYNLERAGYSVSSAVDGEQALAAGRDRDHDLIILDLMLPRLSGMEVLRALRAEEVPTPVVILSARGSEADRVAGLKLGADDYVSKPFSRPELLARVEAVLRRQPKSEGHRRRFTAGGLIIDPDGRVASVQGQDLAISARSFDLLAFVAANPERIFSRDQLLDRVWGAGFDGGQRTVDVHVSWLRTTLRRATGHDYFRTIRGVGYAFSPPRP